MEARERKREESAETKVEVPSVTVRELRKRTDEERQSSVDTRKLIQKWEENEYRKHLCKEQEGKGRKSLE